MSANPAVQMVAVTGGLRLGGSTTFLVNLGRALRGQGGLLRVISFSKRNEMQAEFALAGIQVECLSEQSHIYEDRLRLAYAEIARWRPRAVLACLGTESFEMLRSVPPGVARIGVIQSDDPGPYQAARGFASWLDAMVGVSSTIQRKLAEEPALAHTRIECIPYGIEFGPPQVRVRRDPAKPIRLLYLGRMIEMQKRISRLVELAKILTTQNESFEFTFAGAGPQLAAAKSELGALPNVRFLGEVANRQVGALLREQDVFVLLSDFEGLPLSLIEAMGEGVVPVVSDIESGLREVVSSDIGIRVPIGGVLAAAEAIATLRRDPERLARMSAASMERARSHYSAEKMAGRYLALTVALSTSDPNWPATIEIPTPLMGERSWLYRGLPRHARRWLKRVRRMF